MKIVRNWSKICFPKINTKIKTLDKKQIGKAIKEQRLFNGYSLKHVADLVQINESTLRSYEEGTRLVRLDVIYKLAQIYNLNTDTLIEKSKVL